MKRARAGKGRKSCTKKEGVTLKLLTSLLSHAQSASFLLSILGVSCIIRQRLLFVLLRPPAPSSPLTKLQEGKTSDDNDDEKARREQEGRLTCRRSQCSQEGAGRPSSATVDRSLVNSCSCSSSEAKVLKPTAPRVLLQGLQQQRAQREQLRRPPRAAQQAFLQS